MGHGQQATGTDSRPPRASMRSSSARTSTESAFRVLKACHGGRTMPGSSVPHGTPSPAPCAARLQPALRVRLAARSPQDCHDSLLKILTNLASAARLPGLAPMSRATQSTR